jgi:hypothetical protein
VNSAPSATFLAFAKVDEHRKETKVDNVALRSVVGGMSYTRADHEERINALEGE